MSQEAAMDNSQMQALVDSHMTAENHGDIDGAVTVYTNDVEHDVVGFPNSPSRGKDAARDFYAYLTANFRSESWDVVRQFLADDAMVLEQLMTGTVIGSLLGLPGNGRRISFRMLHVFEFRDGLISRENIWLDAAAVADQLS
ncbi:MAG TPA: ester cyclase [Mycobacterium sp.]|jgi:steroid delta-isomerase-like uncharacterized protein|uniref:nuclear transport factor 2 family protein n=1 Tax=Mycobacterium sp. TaxID=1785 RepID=UPI002F3F362D